MVKLILSISQCVINPVLLCLWFRRPRRGFQNWARWRSGRRWAVGKQRREAAQTVMMKMDVKPQEMVRARPVSNTCPTPYAQTHIHRHTHIPSPTLIFPLQIAELLSKVMSPNLVHVSVICILYKNPTASIYHLPHDVHSNPCDDETTIIFSVVLYISSADCCPEYNQEVFSLFSVAQ